MTQIENQTLHIHINHPCPEEYKADLKYAIISAIQQQDIQSSTPEQLHFVSTTLLELLKNIS